jgi:hypothetical protein
MAFPYGYTVFCDDIRQEVGGKITFVGTYRQALIVHGTFPITLPKFAMAIHYLEKTSETPEKVDLKVFFPGDADDAPSISGELSLAEASKGVPDAEKNNPKRVSTFTTQIVIAPFELKASGSIKVRIKRGDQIIRVGRLRVTAIEAKAKDDS